MKIIKSYINFWERTISKIYKKIDTKKKKERVFYEIIEYKDKQIKKLKEHNKQLFNTLQKITQENIALKNKLHNYEKDI